METKHKSFVTLKLYISVHYVPVEASFSDLCFYTPY